MLDLAAIVTAHPIVKHINKLYNNVTALIVENQAQDFLSYSTGFYDGGNQQFQFVAKINNEKVLYK